MLKAFLSYSLLLLLQLPAYSFSGISVNTGNLVFAHITTANGLSFNSANCVLKDSRGFVWIGTDDGLNRYDANSIYVFRHRYNDTATIADNVVSALAEGNKGTLWIGTNFGLSLMDLQTEKCRNFIPPKPGSGFITKAILIEDSTRVLAGTTSGLYECDAKNGLFTRYYNYAETTGPAQSMSNIITRIYRDSKKRIWVCTSYGIYLFNKSGKSFTRFEAPLTSSDKLVDNLVRDIFEDHQHRLWVATWGGGLKKFSAGENRFSTYKWEPAPESPSTANIVLSVTESRDRNGKYHLWLGTNEGLADFNRDNNTWTFYRNDKQNTNTVNSSYMSQVYSDNSNLLWIAGENGVDVLDANRQLFNTEKFSIAVWGDKAKNFGEVSCVLPQKGNIWVSTWYGNGLYKFDAAFNLIEKWFAVPPGSSNYDSHQVSDLAIDKDSVLWIATFNGLVSYNLRSGKFNRYLADSTKAGSVPYNKISRVFVDAEGVYWIFMYKRGIAWYNPVLNTFQRTGEKVNGRFIDYDTYCQAEDKDGNVWIGCSNEILKYERVKNKFSVVLATGSQVSCLMCDKQGNIWAGTGAGLWRIERGTLKRKFFSTADGISGDIIRGLGQDKQGRIWIATGNGLTLYNPKQATFRIFRTQDGLESDDLKYGFYQAPDDRFFLCGKNYVTWFYPDSLSFNKTIPPVAITGFKVFNRPAPVVLNKNGEKEITIAYNQNEFSFAFAVLNFTNPSFNNFYCKLEGFDNNWRKLEKGFANYTNLNPGSYVFRVKGANNDGVMNETGDYVLLNITPPFWQKWWFYVACCIAAVVSLYSFYRYRVNQLLQIERLRTKIATDLHDDIGATLSSIAMITHVAGNSADYSSKEWMAQIGEHSRGLIGRMDDIVWSLKPANDSPEKIFNRLCSYAAPLCEAKDIIFHSSFDNKLNGKKIEMHYRQHIYMIAKEAINNLLKYSNCTIAELNLVYNDGQLILQVTDNGVGISENRHRQGNGLLHMKQRADEIKARLKIESSIGKGTLIELLVKIG